MTEIQQNLKDIMDDIAEVAQCLWSKGWAERNGGNISVDVTDKCSNQKLPNHHNISLNSPFPELAERSYLVKIGGARMFDVARNPWNNLLIITINAGLDSYYITYLGDSMQGLPTSELLSHLKIHQYLRRNSLPQKVFLHTHPTHLIALTHIPEYCKEEALNKLLFSLHPEVKIHLPEGTGLVAYRLPGSERLADDTVTALQGHRVMVWEKHGCAAVGVDPFEAFDLIDIINKAAQIFFICKAAGYQPAGLNIEQLFELDKVYNKKQS